jgi:hypothetical protein
MASTLHFADALGRFGDVQAGCGSMLGLDGRNCGQISMQIKENHLISQYIDSKSDWVLVFLMYFHVLEHGAEPRDISGLKTMHLFFSTPDRWLKLNQELSYRSRIVVP